LQLSPRVDALLGSMSLEQKAGQIFIFTYHHVQQALNDLRLHPSGYVRIFSDALTVARENERLQAAAEIPLTLSADFERGIGRSVAGAIDLPGNMCLGAADDEQLAFESGRAISEEARAIGVNTNYVPVLDVNINEANPIINTRAFGADPELVARMGVAFFKGSQAGGVVTCGKHFPGHGDTHVDTHTSLGVINVDRKRLDEVELLPFRRAIEAGIDAIMSVHLRIPAVDPGPLPATLSRRIMHELLREELGFDGLVVSDALEMGGMTRHFTPEQTIVGAINAGVDQLIMPVDNQRSVRIVLEAVRDGRISEARLDDAVGRILTCKERGAILDERYRVPDDLMSRINTPEHLDLGRKVALAGATLVRDRGVLPLGPDARVAIITMTNSYDERAHFAEPYTIGAHIEKHVREATTVHAGMVDEHFLREQGAHDRAMQAVAAADVIVVAAYVKVVMNRGTVMLEERYEHFVEALLASGKPLVMVSFGNPYIIKQFRNVRAYVCAYGPAEVTQQATAELLCGKSAFRGRLPVPITL
jgi:beta-N-acetylhexosaminidase